VVWNRSTKLSIRPATTPAVGVIINYAPNMVAVNPTDDRPRADSGNGRTRRLIACIGTVLSVRPASSVNL
jgi:hypothetical protein